MRGKISKTGFFSIYRKNKFKEVFCVDENPIHCGDSCAGFGEPQEVVCDDKEGMMGQNRTKTKLSICCKTYYFDEFEDERI